jgi:hypothetical protein
MQQVKCNLVGVTTVEKIDALDGMVAVYGSANTTQDAIALYRDNGGYITHEHTTYINKSQSFPTGVIAFDRYRKTLVLCLMPAECAAAHSVYFFEFDVE